MFSSDVVISKKENFYCKHIKKIYNVPEFNVQYIDNLKSIVR